MSVLPVHGVDADPGGDQPGWTLDVHAVGGPPLPRLLWQLLPHAHGYRAILRPGPLSQELWPGLHLTGKFFGRVCDELYHMEGYWGSDSRDS